MFSYTSIHNRKYEYFFLIVVVIFSSFLIFYNLDNQYLWQDEAQTALIGKTILSDGVPKGTDGINIFSQELGAEYNDDFIWKLHPWLQFYLVSASYKLFGVNTFTSRLPFALFGICTILLTYFFTKSLFKEKRTAVFVVILLMTSVPFLLLTKQCRYYSPAMFFSVLALYGYYFIINKRKFGYIIFCASSTLLFNSFQIYLVSLLLGTFIHALIYHRNLLLKLIISSIIIMLVNSLGIIWIIDTANRSGNVFTLDIISYYWKFSGYGTIYISKLLSYVFSPILIIACLICFLWRKKLHGSVNCTDEISENIMLLVLFVFTNIFVIAPFVNFPFYRFICPVIPILIILSGYIVSLLSRLSVILSVLLLAVVIYFTNFISYVYEITHDYDGPIEGITKYLNKHGSLTDVVIITYGDLPLKFYTKMRVLGGLTGEDLSQVDPQWIILRKLILCNEDMRVSKYIHNNYSPKKYEKIVIDYPDIPFENREDPEYHNFRTVKNYQKVIIYKKIKTKDNIWNINTEEKYHEVKKN